MAKYKKAQINIPMCLAAVLLCLTMFSLHFTGGLYAKYIVRDSGEDSARVAAFDVKVIGDSDDLVVELDNSGSDNVYEITVNNLSEVAVAYDISVILEDSAESKGVNVVFGSDKSGQLSVNTSKTHEITFEVNDWSKITKEQNGQSADVEIDFTVVVNTVQID